MRPLPNTPAYCALSESRVFIGNGWVGSTFAGAAEGFARLCRTERGDGREDDSRYGQWRCPCIGHRESALEHQSVQKVTLREAPHSQQADGIQSMARKHTPPNAVAVLVCWSSLLAVNAASMRASQRPSDASISSFPAHSRALGHVHGRRNSLVRVSITP